MPQSTPSQHRTFNSTSLSWAAIGFSLAILGATIAFATFDLRSKSRSQLIRQHAQVLYAVWRNQEANDQANDALEITERPSDQWFTLLERGRLPQLVGLHGRRLFDAQGTFVMADVNITKGSLPSADLALMSQLQPVAHFRPDADLTEVGLALSESSPKNGPLLEISLPLHSPNQGQLLGIAQFILDGTQFAAELETLDHNLTVTAALAFCTGGGLLVLILRLGFQQLQRLNRLLTERSLSLLKANQELAMAAKTSAVGAVTTHLIHGLKNPLSGLQAFVAARGNITESDPESDWQLAVSSTRRMQGLITEVVRVLRDEQTETSYEISLDEFRQMLEARTNALAKEAHVTFRSELKAKGVLSNREANLISLILHNLIQNGIQSTPPGKSVTLQIEAVQDKIVCEVRDQGGGIPAAQQKALFRPCQSSKEGGSGVGLAISKQLANCLEAKLELKSTGPQGTVFVLTFVPQGQLARAGLALQTTAG